MAQGQPIGWIVPMPRLGDRLPVISDGWGSPRDGGTRLHRGADWMYKRPRRVSVEQAHREHGSIAYDVPRGTPALAAAAGTVREMATTSRGHSVTLDHGGGWETFYQHLYDWAPGLREGQRVSAGQILGTVGHSPSEPNGIRHLHFAVWRDGDAVDPAPYAKTWRVITVGAGVLTLALVAFVGWGAWKLTR